MTDDDGYYDVAGEGRDNHWKRKNRRPDIYVAPDYENSNIQVYGYHPFEDKDKTATKRNSGNSYYSFGLTVFASSRCRAYVKYHATYNDDCDNCRRVANSFRVDVLDVNDPNSQATISPVGTGIRAYNLMGGFFHEAKRDNALSTSVKYTEPSLSHQRGYRRQFRNDFDGFVATSEVADLLPSSGLIPLWQWYNQDRGDWFVTSDPRYENPGLDCCAFSCFDSVKNQGYCPSREQLFIADPAQPPPPCSKRLISWWSAANGDNFQAVEGDDEWSLRPNTQITFHANGIQTMTNAPTVGDYYAYRVEGWIWQLHCDD